MESLWDYFMRRKALLVLFLACFAVGGFLSWRGLQENLANPPEYISIREWGVPDVEVPLTGGLSEPSPTFAVLTPAEVVAILRPNPTSPSEATESELSDETNSELSNAEKSENTTDHESTSDDAAESTPEDSAPEDPIVSSVDQILSPSQITQQEGINATPQQNQTNSTQRSEGTDTATQSATDSEIAWNPFLILAALAELVLVIYLTQQHFYR